jgi:hypothetical protein
MLWLFFKLNFILISLLRKSVPFDFVLPFGCAYSLMLLFWLGFCNVSLSCPVTCPVRRPFHAISRRKNFENTLFLNNNVTSSFVRFGSLRIKCGLCFLPQLTD